MGRREGGHGSLSPRSHPAGATPCSYRSGAKDGASHVCASSLAALAGRRLGSLGPWCPASRSIPGPRCGPLNRLQYAPWIDVDSSHRWLRCSSCRSRQPLSRSRSESGRSSLTVTICTGKCRRIGSLTIPHSQPRRIGSLATGTPRAWPPSPSSGPPSPGSSRPPHPAQQSLCPSGRWPPLHLPC